MDHPAAQELLSEYLDGELSPPLAEELRAHLESCAACRREYDELREMVTSLSGLKRVPAPAGFVGKVQQRIRRRSRGRFFSPERLLNRFPFEWISFVIIILMLAVYLFYMLGMIQEVTPPRPGGP